MFSHGQCLAQCHEWLNLHLPQAERVAVSSNAEAARMAAEEPGAAAVAGDMAAEHYGLRVLAANIEDEPNNTTRFLVLGDYEPKAIGPRQDLASCCRRATAPGAMHEMLTPFATRGVSMTKFESRPSRTGPLGIPLLRRHRGPSQRRATSPRRWRRWRASPAPQGARLLSHGGASDGRPRPAHRAAPGTSRPRTCAPSRPTVPGKPIAETARELGIARGRYHQAGVQREPAGPSPAGDRRDPRQRSTRCTAIPTATASS